MERDIKYRREERERTTKKEKSNTPDSKEKWEKSDDATVLCMCSQSTKASSRAVLIEIDKQ